VLRLVLVIGLISGCSTYQGVSLPLPVMGELPHVSKEELQCLDKDVNERLKIGDIIWENHIDELESIIKSTH